jgi:tripartite-type tricarboxylate transporter receptor subunit TctC
MKPPRRQFLGLAAGFAALPAISGIARAEAYPNHPITLIVPFAAGGPGDVIARIVSERISRALGQRLVIENVAGAGGTTGTTRAMRANPDGYTLQLGTLGTHAFVVALYPKLAYRPDVDFEPIGVVGEEGFVIVGRKDLQPNDLREFVSYVKANATKLNMAHGGIGSGSHVFCLLLNQTLAVKPTMVPFTGNAPALNALVGGQVDYMCDAAADVVSRIQSRTIKVFAIGADKRSPALPDIPTAEEAGLPEFQASLWYAFFAPRRTPRPIVDKLTDALNEALDDEITRARLFDVGCDIPDKERRGQAPLIALVKREIERWKPIIEGANINAQ